MKRNWKRLLSLCLAAALLLCALSALAEEKSALPEWTVMLYLCGTDLESEKMCATVNLGEICDTVSNESVNFVIETGGAQEWHTLEIFNGLDIASDRLQRYGYANQRLYLMDEQPLANMAEARTLTDFIQWTVKNAPAQKYALMLWDHGGGSFSGIICDDLHGRSIMQVEDLARALKDSGVSFEALITDACLMATLEVAQALAPYARYLVASEEIVPDEGGPYAEWLQYLYDHPACDGGELGEAYDVAVANKYLAISARKLSNITYSTIDLSQIDAVGAAFDAMFTEIRASLSDPDRFGEFGYNTQHVQTFDGSQYDLLDTAKTAAHSVLSQETLNAVQAAVEAAVVDEVHGSARPYANGLSFYYAPQDDMYRLDHFARVCKSAPYLAFLDQVNMGWTAPDWVYEQVERLPDITRADYTVVADAALDENGLPTFTITSGRHAAAVVDAQLYQYDENREQFKSLGADVNVLGTFDSGVFRYAFDGQWLALNGKFCELNVRDELDTHTLYEIPFITENTMDELERDNTNFNLRVGYVYDTDFEARAADPDAPLTGAYTLYGVWNNANSSSSLPNRDVWDVADFDGDETMLIQHAVNVYTGEITLITISSPFTFQSAQLELAEKTLPTGTYAMVFVVRDVFGSAQRSAPFQIEWNAEKKTAVCSVME
ncbi:MAG: clostripain-related cysteine peptidase [Eubacteriales bacterium]|nr:clostripain-related cysteine peptidase [Eubacteriales bacterium]